MNKYVVAVTFRGIGNEVLYINAPNEDVAFRILFEYYRDKSDRLGHWLDGDGEDAGDFNDKDGIFECDADWSWIIRNVAEIKTLGEEIKEERIFCGWKVSDVTSMYSTLTEDQAYKVLCLVDKDADYENGVSYETIESAVSIQYPHLTREDVDSTDKN